MHARVTTVSVHPDKVDEAITLFRDSVLPVAKEQQGFYDLRLLTDRATGKAISISLWETEELMKKGEASGYLQEQYGKFAELFSSQPVAEQYDVSVAE